MDVCPEYLTLHSVETIHLEGKKREKRLEGVELVLLWRRGG